MAFHERKLSNLNDLERLCKKEWLKNANREIQKPFFLKARENIYYEIIININSAMSDGASKDVFL